MQTLHDKSKYRCDVCFTEFTRLYALTNHKKAGRCKLDLYKNTIIQVTPIGMLPSTSTQEKVSGWLNPEPAPPKRQRMDTMSEQPSTSKTMDKGPSTSSTPVRIKGARKQIANQASTALPPTDKQWNPRVPFALNLPTGHPDQKSLGTLPVSSQPDKRNPSPLSLPLPAFALRSPTPTYPPNLEKSTPSDTSFFSGSTQLAGIPISSISSNDSLDMMAAELLRGLGAEGEPHQTPLSSPPPVPSLSLQQDLALSEESSDLPDPGFNPTGRADTSADTESTNSSDSADQEVAYILPGTSSGTQGPLPITNLDQATKAIKDDLNCLIALNSKVIPQDQLSLLCDIHGQLQRFLAPYLLYHRV